MELYLVGGAMRDLLLGRMPTELDFSFSGSMGDFLAAHPDAVCVGKSVNVCLWHGRECMPLRGGTLESDLAARDLTINALALDSAGRLYMHPKAVDDLRDKMMRPASSTAFADDPTRIFRLARFASRWPDWRIAREAFDQMRATPRALLAAIPAERVAKEMLKALALPRPARFFRVLAQGDCLSPWFEEHERARYIPAGPVKWHANSVLGHSLRLMDELAGDAMAVWMALCHDLGKIGTDPALLPHHYGHEARGVPLALNLAKRLRLPAVYARAGALAAEEHMKAGMFATLRTGTSRDLLWRVNQLGLSRPFWKLADADSNSPVSSMAYPGLKAINAVRLPEEWHNRGAESARKLREMQCMALAALSRKRAA
ncbi:HD domain-containing protein [Desulfovibrio desulfuricans]|uniref:HD domain-containing protein n=1 Tax=Desulfovibrio desulfuricans TaxID=876 RepID=UPI0003B60AE8|nr:HD domain-containing protein [Desulfovibrio desulfuricans]